MLFSKIDKSYELTTGMAERLGHDLVADLQKDPELGARALRAAHRAEGIEDGHGLAAVENDVYMFPCGK